MPIAAIVGNWKMNTTPGSARALAADIRSRLRDEDRATVVVCPPSVSLQGVSDVLSGSRITVGTQNIHPETHGAYTGEISAAMAREVAEFAIVGHSERRSLFGESNELVGRKAQAAFEAGLVPIVCVGETLEDRRGGRAAATVVNQLDNGMDLLQDVSQVMVAYEPVWAIGTGEAATPGIANEMMAEIRSRLESRFGSRGSAVPLLYGGSVNAENIQGFMREGEIGGALVGGASLDAESFVSIVKGAVAAAG